MATILPAVIYYMLFSEIPWTESLVCLKWSIDGDDLVLTCRIDRLNLAISIVDPNMVEQAHCFMPLPASYCRSVYGNISQDLTTNETTFTVSPMSGQGLNGQWSCVHGRDNERADTMVRIPTRDNYMSIVPDVHFNIPKYIVRRQDVLLECSIRNIVDTVPEMNVTFLVNGESYGLVHYTNFGCRSWINNATCNKTHCHCNKEGTSFGILYHVIGSTNITQFSCVVDLTPDIRYSDCGFGRIIDMVNPKIKSNPTFPVLNGTHVSFECSVFIEGHAVQLMWNCMDLSSKTIRDSTSGYYVTSQNTIVTSSHDTENCSCSVLIEDDIVASTSITLMTTKVPVLIKSSDATCKSTHAVTLTCSIANTKSFTEYGYSTWTHTRNGRFIRHLVGIGNGDVNMLYIWNCNDNDAGEYTCRTWGTFLGRQIWTNESIQLSVEGPNQESGSVTSYLPYIVTGSISLVFILLGFVFLFRRHSSVRHSRDGSKSSVQKPWSHVRESIIYHAAPAEQVLPNSYVSTNPHYEEIGDIPVQNEVPLEYEEVDKVDIVPQLIANEPIYLEPY